MLLAFYENQLHHRNIYFVFGIDLSRSGSEVLSKQWSDEEVTPFSAVKYAVLPQVLQASYVATTKQKNIYVIARLLNLESTSHSTSYEHDEDAENVENTGNDHADDGAIHQVRLFTSTKHIIYSKICWKLHLYVKYYCPWTMNTESVNFDHRGVILMQYIYRLYTFYLTRETVTVLNMRHYMYTYGNTYFLNLNYLRIMYSHLLLQKLWISITPQ